MRILRVLTAATVLSLSAGTARGDGLLYQLPKDGAWVAFDFQENAERRGEKVNRRGTFYMSSVGRTREGDDECRWIEFKWEGRRNEVEKGPYITKILIPEKYLKKGENPLEQMVRGWSKFGEGNARELGRFFAYSTVVFAPAWLTGSLEDVQRLDKKVVEVSSAKFECEGLTGYTEYEFPGGQAKKQMTFRTWLHKRAPFGVVSTHIESETTSVDGETYRTATTTLKLSDFGDGAESELPDHN